MSFTKNKGNFKNPLLKALIASLLLLCVGIGSTYAQLTERDSLENYIVKMRSRRDFDPRDSIFIGSLNKLASELRYYKTDSLLLLSQEAYKLSELAEDLHGKSKSLIGMGNYYSDLGNHDRAISHYQRALVLAMELEDSGLILEIQNNIAGAHDYKGDYAEALSGYLKGIELATRVDNKKNAVDHQRKHCQPVCHPGRLWAGHSFL